VSHTEESEELVIEEFRSFVIRCTNGRLDVWRWWLLKKFADEDEGLCAVLGNRDLSSTFGAIVVVLSTFDQLDKIVADMVSDKELTERVRRNSRRSFRPDWRWNSDLELNPDYQLIVKLRQRFKSLRFPEFLSFVIQAFSEEHQDLAINLSYSSDLCEFVHFLRCLGKIEFFQLWLESYRGVQPERPEVWTTALRHEAKDIESPEGRATLRALAELYVVSPLDSEALFSARRQLLRRLRLMERTSECLFADPSDPDHQLIWWEAFARHLPSSVPSKFRRRVRDLSELRRLAAVTRDLRQRLFWANSVLGSGAEG